MTTVEERREVARRLRELKNPYWHDSGSSEAYMDVMGVETYLRRNGLHYDLADLIDPGELKTACIIEVKIEGEKLYEVADRAVAEYTGINRGALLELAEELEMPMRDGGYSKRIARRIREACGEVER